MITIYFDKDKVNKQVIKPSEKFFYDKNKIRNYGDLMKDARAIAFDLTNGTYDSVEVEFN